MHTHIQYVHNLFYFCLEFYLGRGFRQFCKQGSMGICGRPNQKCDQDRWQSLENGYPRTYWFKLLRKFSSLLKFEYLKLIHILINLSLVLYCYNTYIRFGFSFNLHRKIFFFFVYCRALLHKRFLEVLTMLRAELDFFRKTLYVGKHNYQVYLFNIFFPVSI